MTRSPASPAISPAPAVAEVAPARIDGLDLARFAALIGMMCAHTWVLGEGDSAPLLASMVSGKAAALFAVLAGVGIALTSRHAAARGDYRAARLNLLGRGAALIVLGLTLGLISPLALVILAYYGVMFWLALPALRWSPRALLIAAGAWAVVWPIAAHWLRLALGGETFPASPTWFSLAEPLPLLRDLLLDGGYPAIAWVAYLLLGLGLGKLLIAARADADPAGAVRRLGVRAAIGGAAATLVAFGIAKLLAVAVAAQPLAAALGTTPAEALRRLDEGDLLGSGTESPWLLLTTAGHSGTPVDLWITGGIAAAIIGIGLLAGPLLGERARRILAPALGAGSAPLTVYAVHLVALAPAGFAMLFVPGLEDGSVPWWLSSPWLWLAHIALALVVGMLVRWSGRRGPLERLVTAVGRALAR